MKAFIALALVAAAHAVPHLEHGTSVSSRSEDGLGNYKFAYDEKHSSGGSFRQEAGGHHGVHGSYGLHDADGRQRVVSYVADGHGFRAAIKTNEPGTAPQAAAATSIATHGHAAVAKVVAAPIVAHASYVAPVLAKAPVVLGHGYGHGYGNGYGYGGGYGGGYGHGYGHGHSYGYGVAHHGYGGWGYGGHGYGHKYGGY